MFFFSPQKHINGACMEENVQATWRGLLGKKYARNIVTVSLTANLTPQIAPH